MWLLVEKANHLAIHGMFDTRERADWFLTTMVPLYVARSYYMNKSLTVSSFEVIRRQPKEAKCPSTTTSKRR